MIKILNTKRFGHLYIRISNFVLRISCFEFRISVLLASEKEEIFPLSSWKEHQRLIGSPSYCHAGVAESHDSISLSNGILSAIRQAQGLQNDIYETTLFSLSPATFM